MIGPSGRPLMIYLAARPVDFRKGHDGLSALAGETWGESVQRRGLRVPVEVRAQIKVLVWDQTGLVLARSGSRAVSWFGPACATASCDCRPRSSRRCSKGSIGGLFDPSARAVQSLRDDRDQFTGVCFDVAKTSRI